MPVVSVTPDIDATTITIVAEFAAPIERVWGVYADPRQLEKVWGPPGFPATFVDFDMSVGGRMQYFMTGPEGEKFAGYWEITAVDEPNSFAFNDGFADEDFNVNPDLSVSENHYRFESIDSGTRATYFAQYPSAEALQQVLEMGLEEGSRAAIDQIDVLLAS